MPFSRSPAEKRKEAMRGYRATYRAKHASKIKAYLKRTRKKRKAYAQEYYGDHRERLLAEKRRYYHKVKDTPEYRAKRDRWYRENREHAIAAARARYKKDTSVAFFLSILRKFGCTKAQYVALSKKQGGKCAICRKTPEERKARSKRLSVDHDHVSGKIRGLLCAACNSAVGMLLDDVAVLRRATAYLEKSRAV